MAAGRTVVAASAASFDCLVLCSAFQGARLQAWCQTPSGTPSPAGRYCLGRWRWQPSAAPGDNGRSPERQAFGSSGRSHTEPGAPEAPGSGIAPMPAPPQGAASCGSCRFAHQTRRRGGQQSVFSYSLCTHGTKDRVWHTVGAH